MESAWAIARAAATVAVKLSARNCLKAIPGNAEMLEMGGRSSLQREIFSMSATMKEGFALCGAAASVLREIPRQLGRRTRQISHIVATTGFQGVLCRARFKASDWIRPREPVWPVVPDDIIAADLSQPFCAQLPEIDRGAPITVNWVTGPAGRGSGGHTTLYRIVNHLQNSGYLNRVYLYDPYAGDPKYYQGLAREHYGLTCEIGDIRDGMKDADALVATSWPTAYAVFNARCAGKRFYFVQDYEPYFYPVGTNSVLAENTYRMGFHGITAGRWLAEKLVREFGMQSDYFPFGCDTDLYRRDPASKRSGIAFYARVGTPRRAVELGLLALRLFAKRQPQIELHLFGERIDNLPFRVTNHGLLSPQGLNEIYNRCFAGLSLSLTNVSLVPHEMLASGCLPVVNDAAHNRIVLDNAYVRYAQPTPHLLAAALESVVSIPDFASVSKKASESVAPTSWNTAGMAVDRALRVALRQAL